MFRNQLLITLFAAFPFIYLQAGCTTDDDGDSDSGGNDDSSGSDTETDGTDDGDADANDDDGTADGSDGTTGDSTDTTDDGSTDSEDSGDDTSTGDTGDTDDGSDDTDTDDTDDSGDTGTDDGSDTGTDDGGDDATFQVDISLASDVEPSAPGTVGIVTWSADLDDITEASLQFGLDTTYGMVAPVDLAEPNYRTLLLGMKPNRTYHVRVAVTSGGTEYFSDDYTVETGGSTNLVTIDEFNIVDDAAREHGFILTTNWQRQGDGSGSAAYIIDADGEVVWWAESPVGSAAAARMSADGKRVWMLTESFNNGALAWVSMDTLESEVFTDLGSPSHDVWPVEGDIMAYLDYNGSPNDAIVEIDPTGATTVVSTLDTEMIEHSNALRYYPDEGIYMYSDWQYDVHAVNRSDGSVAWSLSDLGVPAYGGHQHGVHLLADSVLIFANNGGAADTAAAMEFSRSDGSLIFSFDSEVQVRNFGDIQRLPNGNTLLTCSTAGRIYEVDPDGNEVLTIRTAAMGYAGWRESLYGPPQEP